jgi:hypothetical protein
LVARVGQGQFQVRIGLHEGRAVLQRGRQHQHCFLLRVGMQVRRLDADQIGLARQRDVAFEQAHISSSSGTRSGWETANSARNR